MALRNIGYLFLILALCSNSIYAYKRNKTTKNQVNSTKILRNNFSKSPKFSVLAFLKEKFIPSDERLRPSRSEKMAYHSQKNLSNIYT